MKLSAVFSHKVRGFRVLDLTALAVFLVLALTVYAFKTFAGDQRADIVDVESQIRDESRHVRLLKAEIAQLESPARLERLSVRYADQAPITARQEVSPEALPQVAAAPQPAAPAPGAAKP
jgi:hypothetical protein